MVNALASPPLLALRDAMPQEAEVLSALARRSKSHWGHSAAFMAACQTELTQTAQHITDPQWHYCVAEQAAMIVGFYAVETLDHPIYELEALFVEPMYIGTGIGRALMQHARNYLASQGAHKLVIQSDPNATPFYQAMGGQFVSSRQSDSMPGRLLPMFEMNIHP